MKKTIIATVIAAATFSSEMVQAESFPFLYQIDITNAHFEGTDYAATGSLVDSGGGFIAGIDQFFYHTWSLSQATTFMDSSGSFAGSNEQGAWDYNADISSMTADQIAVGLFWDTTIGTNMAVLEIFDCVSVGPELFSPIACTGNGIAIDNGSLIGTIVTLSGTGHSAIPDVPVPAAAWLMGSGLLGLISLARRRRY